MDIVFSCSCGKRLHAKENHVGRRAKCPACGEVSIVPPPTSPEPGAGRQVAASKTGGLANIAAQVAQETYGLEPTPARATPEVPNGRNPWSSLAPDDENEEEQSP